MITKQHVILCEGYDDRAFWSGWLTHLECQNLFEVTRGSPLDPWKIPVSKGHYAFATPGKSFIRIQPYRGKSNLHRAVKLLFNNQQTSPMERLIINVDSDDDGDAATTSARDQISNILRQQDSPATPDEQGAYRIGEVMVAAVIWTCDDAAAAPGVPAKQTLERLVAAAIAAAYPDRGQAVADWLAAAPAGAAASHKQHGLSYLAKWYAEHGCDDFYKALWRDPLVAGQLEHRLRACGAWHHAQSLAAA